MLFRQTAAWALALPMVAGYAHAENFGTTGTITGEQSANLITDAGSGRAIVFGTGYKTDAYQMLYSADNLAPFYPGYVVSEPTRYVDAASVPESGYNVRPYNVFNIAIRGAGLYSVRIADSARPIDFITSLRDGKTVDLMAGLYAKRGYGSAFDAANPLQNLVVLNDDNSAYGYANPYPLFFQNDNAKDCVTLSIVYFPWESVETPYDVRILGSGPGQVVNSCATMSLQSSLDAVANRLGTTAAKILDANPALFDLFSQLESDEQRSDAVNQTLPLLGLMSMKAVNSVLSSVNHIIYSRIDNNRGMASGDSFAGNQFLWMKPFGSWANQDNSLGVPGYKAKTYGTAIGMDRPLSPRLNLGAAFAFARTDLNGASTVAPQGLNVDVYQLIGYGSYRLSDRTDLSFQADIGRNKTSSHRVIGFTSSVASARFDSTTAHAGVSLDRRYYLNDDTTLTPSLRMDYTWVRDDGYSENGAGPLSLNVRGRSAEQLIVGGEGKLARKLNEQTTFVASLGAGYDVLNQRSAITASYAGAADAAFVTYGVKPSAWIARGGLGLVYKTRDGLEVTGRYDADRRENFKQQTASVNLRWIY